MKKVLIVLFAVTVAVSLTLKATRSPQQVVLPPGESSTIARGRMGEPPGLVATQTVDRSSAGLATAAQLANGAKIYRTLCVSCHLPDGKGMLTAVPPLAGSDYMLADRARTIRGVLKGVSGPITVNQVTYNAVMPPLEAVLSDRQVADVLTYVFNSWGNQGDAFDADFVGLVRAGAGPP